MVCPRLSNAPNIFITIDLFKMSKVSMCFSCFLYRRAKGLLQFSLMWKYTDIVWTPWTLVITS